MRWDRKEVFWFEDDKYEQRARNMSPDALWTRQARKKRSTVTSGTSVGFSSIATVATLGLATPGLIMSGRALDIARRKRNIIKREVNRRNLPHYKTKAKDILIPLGTSLAMWSTIGIIDVFCLAGTSTAVGDGVSGNIVQAMMQDPSAFMSKAGEGMVFQAQQFFHLGGQHLALGADHFQTTVGDNGFHALVHHVSPSVVAPGGIEQAAVASLDTVMSTASFIAKDVLGANGINVATQGADQFLVLAGHGNPTEVAGLVAGMKAAQATETQVASLVVGNTGLAAVSETISVDEGKSITKSEAESKTLQIAQSLGPEKINNAYAEALTASKQQPFVFLSQNSQPISQRILSVPSSQHCVHSSQQATLRSCKFCSNSIDASTSPYYHCCTCSTAGSSFDLCEVCVAGRGCSCPFRNDHFLFRKGILSATVEYGVLEQATIAKIET